MIEPVAMQIPDALLEDDAASWTLLTRGRHGAHVGDPLREATAAVRLSVAALAPLARPRRLEIEGRDGAGALVERRWGFAGADRDEAWARALTELEHSELSPGTVSVKLELRAWVRVEPDRPPALRWLVGPTTLTWFADAAQPWMALALDHVVLAGLRADRSVDPDLAVLNRPALARALTGWAAAVGDLHGCAGEGVTMTGYAAATGSDD